MTRKARVVFQPLLDDGTNAYNGEMFINPAQKVLYYKDANGFIYKLSGGSGGGGGGSSGGTGSFDDIFVSGSAQIDGATVFGAEVNFNLVKVYGVRDPQGDDEAVNLRVLNNKIQAYSVAILSTNPVLMDSNKALFTETVNQWGSTTNLTITEDAATLTPYNGKSAKVQFSSSTSWEKTIYDKTISVPVKAAGSVNF